MSAAIQMLEATTTAGALLLAPGASTSVRSRSYRSHEAQPTQILIDRSAAAEGGSLIVLSKGGTMASSKDVDLAPPEEFFEGGKVEFLTADDLGLLRAVLMTTQPDVYELDPFEDD